MFKFAKDIPFHRLVNQTIWWICFSQNGFSLSFENDDKIIINNFRQFADRNNTTEIKFAEELRGTAGSSVISFKIIDTCEMHMEILGYSKRVIFFDKDEDFENYVFSIGEIEYVV